MSSDPSQKQPPPTLLGPPPQASVTVTTGNGITNSMYHFGLLEVPPPAVFNAGVRLASSSIDQPQCAGTVVTAARDSLETAVQPSRSDQELSLGSARSRDAAAREASARSGKTGSGLAKLDGTSSSPPSGRPIRPRPIPLMQSGDSRGKSGKTTSPSQRNAVVPMGGLEASKLEGSATSDENVQPRLVPRKGAGPELRREGGGKIDEYLMRLLRNGNTPATSAADAAQSLKADAIKAEASLPPVAPGSAAPAATPSAWQGSRLGPLAPGTGVKSSSVQPAVPSPAGAPAPFITTGVHLNGKGVGKQSLASQPSTTGGETSTEPPQNSQSAQFGRAGSKPEAQAAPPGGIDAAGDTLMGTPSDVAKAALGEQLWGQLQSTITKQAQEFQQQLEQLHGLVARQAELEGQIRARSRSQQSHPPLFVGQRPPAARSQGPPTSAAPWWLSTMPWAGFHTTPSTWPNGGATENTPSLDGSHSQLTGSNPAKLSRTTQIVLDAQRRRRGSKGGRGNRGTSSRKERETTQQRSNGEPGQGTEGKGSEGQPPTWFSVMQPYMQQGQGSCNGSQRSGGGPPGYPFDPLSAWYHYHFGQLPNGAAPPQINSAAYSSQLIVGPSAFPETGWENRCNQYFNFSMPGTSDNKTANTGPTSSRQQRSLAFNQAVSATPAGPPGSLRPPPSQQPGGLERDQGHARGKKS